MARRLGSVRPFRPVTEDRDIPGLLAEVEYIHEGLRQNQRERQVCLGFAIAATAALIGFLLQGEELDGSASFLIVAVIGLVIFGAEVLTVRSTIGVGSAAAYKRLFL
jgi:hypothetical protein